MKLKINAETLGQALSCLIVTEPSRSIPEDINLCSANYKALRGLLESGVCPNTPNWEGTLPLHFFCCVGESHMVALLLSHGADPDRWDAEGRAAVHYAIRRPDENVLRMLKQAGANLAKPDSRGWTIVEHAEDIGFPRFINLAKQLIGERPARAQH